MSSSPPTTGGAADVDACDGAAITGAELDTTTRSVSIRWRERTDGTPDEVYVEPTDTGEDTGTVVDTADDSGADTADSAASRDDSGGSAGGPGPEGCGCASAAAARGSVGVLVLAMGWGVRRRRANVRV
jgi:MYXO-CTERM domain-containing protein